MLTEMSDVGSVEIVFVAVSHYHTRCCESSAMSIFRVTVCCYGSISDSISPGTNVKLKIGAIPLVYGRLLDVGGGMPEMSAAAAAPLELTLPLR
jgi:hypothetical protein